MKTNYLLHISDFKKSHNINNFSQTICISILSMNIYTWREAGILLVIFIITLVSTLLLVARTHTHTPLYISLQIPSRTREQTDNHCQNLHLAVNPCQDSSPSSMYLVMICWIVTRSDGTNKDNCWLNIEF